MRREECPRCGHLKVWSIRRQRRRCARCRYDWRPGPPLQLSRPQWEAVLRGHVRGLHSQSIAKETGLHRQRILRALSLIRARMAQVVPPLLHDIQAMKTIAPIDFPARGEGPLSVGPAPTVLGILCRGGQVWAKVIKEKKVRKLIYTIRMELKKGSIVCSDLYKKQNGGSLNHSIKHLLNGRDSRTHGNPLNGLEGFWSYFRKQRLVSGGRSNQKRFPLYLAEVVWRYNHRFLTVQQRVQRLMKLLTQPEGIGD
ncbi:MAG: transposase [Elusimicrobia bacterium]|nr:transposase [Elusimicrobiota bacterium]